MPVLRCDRCHREAEQQAFKPFPNALGDRIFASICRDCWADWLKTQQQLINHYALIPHQPKSREFLLKNMQEFLFGEGAPDRVP